MKKNDKNIIITIIIILIIIVIWTFSQYTTTKHEAEKIKEQKAQALLDKKKKEALEEIPEEIKDEIPTITATDLNLKMRLPSNNIELVDARSFEEFNNGHIRNSTHINQLDALRPESTVVFITKDGNESSILDIYHSLAETRMIYNLKDGINAWLAKGLPTISLNIEENFENSSKIQLVEPRDLNAINTIEAKNDIFILDTRRINNFKKEHIPNAYNIPFVDLESRSKEIPTQKNIYVYGIDAEASFKAGVLLYDLNIIGAKTVNGGYKAWKEYGYPIETSSADTDVNSKESLEQ
jgi:hydroxyacylglutathione hydrolase